MIYEVECFL